MRTPNASALAELATKLGTEPVFIIEVNWGDDLPLGKYADKTIFGIPGTIISVSSLDSIIKVGTGGTSQSLDVVIDDSDESIKAIIDAYDPHKRPVSVYQAFEGLLESDKFLLFSGTVVTPIRWDERTRQISLSIETNVEDKEVGFSPEQGEFEFISDRAVGKAWPLCFGSPLRVPAVKLTEKVRGTSLTRYGLITQANLDTLCDRAATLASQEVIKAAQDTNAGISEENYNTTLANLASAQASLNVFLEGLIVDSPTQEANLRSYTQVCKDIQTTTDERTNSLASFTATDEALTELTAELDVKQIELANAIAVYNGNPTPANLAVVEGLQQEVDQIQNGFPGNVTESLVKIEQYEVLIALELAKADDGNANTSPDLSDIAFWQDAIRTEKLFLEALSGGLYDNIVEGPPYPDGDILNANVDTPEQASGISALAQNKQIFLTQIVAANSSLASFNETKTNLEAVLTRVVISEIVVDGGEDFPQGTPVNIIINGAKFGGTFSGEVFTVAQPELPLFENISFAPRQNDNANEFWLSDPTINLKGQFIFLGDAITHVAEQEGTRCFANPILYQAGNQVNYGTLSRLNYNFRLLTGAALSPTPAIQATSSIFLPQWLAAINALDKPTAVTGLANLVNQDYNIEIGDEVYLEGNYTDLYVANLIPSTEVKEVLAFRTINGTRKLLPVPSRLYTVNLNESIAGQNATTIRMVRPLTEFVDENWEEQIYVSLTSTVGPNTSDIIKYIVDNYMDLATDAATFASVAASIAAYPSHFALLELKNGLSLIEDIAFQARCAVFVKNDTVFIKYLAAEETSVVTLNVTNTDFGSFVVEATPTEDLVTKFVAIWQDDYVQLDEDEEPNKLVLRNNVTKYGLLEKEFDFFIYNIRELVLKAATFWIIRLSNTWKILRCQVFLDSLEVESLDTVSLDFPNNLIATSSVKGVTLEADYNSDSNRVEMRIQSSVQSGQLLPHPLFFPASAAAGEEYPTSFDQFAGGGQ